MNRNLAIFTLCLPFFKTWPGTPNDCINARNTHVDGNWHASNILLEYLLCPIIMPGSAFLRQPPNNDDDFYIVKALLRLEYSDEDPAKWFGFGPPRPNIHDHSRAPSIFAWSIVAKNGVADLSHHNGY